MNRATSPVRRTDAPFLGETAVRQHPAGRARHGGDLVTESLAALGATTVFGVPGQHALAVFEALHRSTMQYVGTRTETSATFAADAFARITGTVAPLLVSTGPGALMTLPALQEAAAACSPVLGNSSQIPSDGLGGRRKGYWHELADQQASFRDIVKTVRVVRSASQIPSALTAAWEDSLTVPCGPCWVEIPEDVLCGPTDVPPVVTLTPHPRPLLPRPELISEAAALLSAARRPVVLAGGGVVRADACEELLALAEKLNAPVATTYGGKGAFPWQHPLSLQSWMEDTLCMDMLANSDALLVVGSGLGQDSSNQHRLRPRGPVIQIEAELGKLEANLPALAIHADARPALAALLEEVSERLDQSGHRAADELRTSVQDRLAAQRLDLEQGILRSIRCALPDDAPHFWDMTILGYWALAGFDARRPHTMYSAQGACGLGYAFPAALGAAVADPSQPVLAVSGDGGAMYCLAELATARQLGLDVTWLIVDDGGYGILRTYMDDAYGLRNGTPATELPGPDFVALAASFGVPAVSTTAEDLQDTLAAALTSPGPNVVVLPATLRALTPS